MSQRHLVRRAIAFAALLSLPVLGAMRQEPQTQVLPPQDPQGQAEAKPDPRTPLQQALSEIRKVLLLGGRAEAEQVFDDRLQAGGSLRNAAIVHGNHDRQRRRALAASRTTRPRADGCR